MTSVGEWPYIGGFTDTSLAFYIAAIFNAGSTLGRILPNALSDRIGVFNAMAPLTLPLASSYSACSPGVVIALPPLCFRVLTENKAMIGTRTGQGFAIGGLGLLLAGPSAGAILGTVEPRNWTGLWVYGGVTLCAVGLILFGLRFMKSGLALMVKC
ncbi:hypothetical protein MYCTH_2130352 [Thermothelomyces thermophilus ATCC 42464]|uniref:Major facilitator superfamily (MFS) profile domain-containing protein n=1 Tax=Thermothelomyces thermophilus (strain ATCC 42464 / BCRC 31852 / DSM 1799) TaxID=573729 RepID=G2QMM0_THET4|nr:uncharacterized protein MYCTH_2130352 [Thermothelomyces thermophilus ATCC 42464]AEO61200.1 hypothetical protein MYCTH_2130352 [Thermothelomyces thermophilus ATCC 42464]